MLQHNLNPLDAKDAEQAISKAQISFANTQGAVRMLLNGEDVSGVIRNEKVGNAASAASTHPCVRVKLFEMQRRLAKENGAVMDGRDIGTVVLPDANLKIYLTASPEERAKRRHLELIEKGRTDTLEEVLADINARDERDMNRKESPLKVADDAVIVDNTHLNAEETVAYIMQLVAKKS